MTETYRGIVDQNQLDHMGHMNIQWYTAKFADATWHLFSRVGITNAYNQENDCGMAVLEMKTQFKAELMAGALLVVRSEFLEFGDKVLKLKHYLYDSESETLSATCELLVVHLDKIKRKAIPLPDFVKENGLELLV